jgi:hypothetical protein
MKKGEVGKPEVDGAVSAAAVAEEVATEEAAAAWVVDIATIRRVTAAGTTETAVTGTLVAEAAGVVEDGEVAAAAAVGAAGEAGVIEEEFSVVGSNS